MNKKGPNEPLFPLNEVKIYERVGVSNEEEQLEFLNFLRTNEVYNEVYRLYQEFKKDHLLEKAPVYRSLKTQFIEEFKNNIDKAFKKTINDSKFLKSIEDKKLYLDSTSFPKFQKNILGKLSEEVDNYFTSSLEKEKEILSQFEKMTENTSSTKGRPKEYLASEFLNSMKQISKEIFTTNQLINTLHYLKLEDPNCPNVFPFNELKNDHDTLVQRINTRISRHKSNNSK